MKQTLTLSGNEITDTDRINAPFWSTSQSGGQADGLSVGSGIFIGRAATNLFRWGQCDTINDWNVGLSSGGTASRAIDASTPAPYSPQSIKYTTGGEASGQGCEALTAAGQAAPAGTSMAGSVWFKGVPGNVYRVFTKCQQTDATAITSSIATFIATGGWQLITGTSLAVPATKTGDWCSISIRTDTARVESFWVAHAMLESGQSVVAPYVATSGGSTATKNAARVQAPATLLSATQGWVAMRVKMGTSASAAVDQTLFSLANLSGSGRVTLHAISGKWSLNNLDDSGTNTVLQVSSTYAAGDIVTVIAAWDASSIKISVNGGAFTSLARGNVPTGMTGFDIGSRAGSAQLDGDDLWLACGTGTLTDSDATNIYASPDITPHGAIPVSAQLTGIFPHPGFSTLQNPIVIT